MEYAESVLAHREGRGDLELSPPRILRWVFDFRRWGVLPYGGGLWDQPVGLLGRMALAEDLFHAWMEYRTLRPGELGKWTRENPSAWQLVKWAREVMKHGEGTEHGRDSDTSAG